MRRMSDHQQLAAETESLLRDFLYWPTDHHYVCGTLFTAASSLFDMEGNFTPYAIGRPLFISNDAGTGKSLSTRLLCALIPGGREILNPTSYGLASLINHGASPGIHEIDKKLGPRGTRNSDLMSIILGGYEKGATIVNSRSDEPNEVNIYAPMILNGNHASLIMHSESYQPFRDRGYLFLLEKPPADHFLLDFDPELHMPRIKDLRNRWRKFGVGNHRSINSIDVVDIIDKRIKNRPRQIWTILFRVAEFLGGDWPMRCQDAARAFCLGEYASDDTPALTPAEELLSWAHGLFAANETFLPTSILIKRLLTTPDGKWWQREWNNPRAASMGLARTLSIFGIEATREYHQGTQTRGYSLADFEEEEETTKTTCELQDNQDNLVPLDEWDWDSLDA